MKLLDHLYISVQSRLWRTKDKVKEFMNSQDGVSNVVATIIILLIVVLLIGVFWDRLKTFVGDMMNTIFNTEFTDGGL